MKFFNIKIANTVFSITTNYNTTFKMCKKYLTNEEGKKIVITKEDIEFEREKTKQEKLLENIKPHKFKDCELEVTAVYRKIADYFSCNNGALIHGALIENDNNGYLFTAKSGVGKTTHIKNWLKIYKQTKIINGDKPIFKIENNNIVGYGTPWSGKENYNTNASVQLKAIIIIKRDTTNHIEKTATNDALSVILTQIYKSNNNLGMKYAVEFAYKLLSKVNVYTLYCNKNKQSAIVAHNAIT